LTLKHEQVQSKIKKIHQKPKNFNADFFIECKKNGWHIPFLNPISMIKEVIKEVKN